jgi:hypothetical protein
MRRGGAAASSNNKEAPTFYGVPPLFTIYNLSFPPVSLKEIHGIHLIPHIIQHFVVRLAMMAWLSFLNLSISFTTRLLLIHDT